MYKALEDERLEMLKEGDMKPITNNKSTKAESYSSPHSMTETLKRDVSPPPSYSQSNSTNTIMTQHSVSSSYIPKRYDTVAPPKNYSFMSIFKSESHSQASKDAYNLCKLEREVDKRWPTAKDRDIIQRYWKATRMDVYWNDLYDTNPTLFEKMMKKGYMEPIPVQWITSRKLTWKYPPGNPYESPAEKRLYYYMNNGMVLFCSL